METLEVPLLVSTEWRGQLYCNEESKSGKDLFELAFEAIEDEIRTQKEEVFIARYETAITTSMMMSPETAFDVHAVFEAFSESYICTAHHLLIGGVMRRVMKRIVKRGNYHHAPLFLDFLRRGLDTNDKDFMLATVLRGERAVEQMYENETCGGALPSEHSQHAFTVAVAAVLHLLAFVFQYLIGYIDRGGTKTYSSGCFDFRASFVSVVLFHGAYVWIKFRQADHPSTGKRKACSTQLDHPGDDSYDPRRLCVRGEKFEARYTIPKDIDEVHPVNDRRISLRSHKTREEAAFISRVAQCYYEDQPGVCYVMLQGKPHPFLVPAMSEQELCLVGEKKKKWVKNQAEDVGKKEYEKYAKQLAPAPSTGSNYRSPSVNGLEAPSCSNVPHQPRSVETVGEELNPGTQEQHEVRTQILQGRVISEGVVSPPCEDMLPRSPAMADCDHHPEGVVSPPCEDMLPRSPAMADCDHHPEGGTLDGYISYSDFAPLFEMLQSRDEAAEQGSEPQSGPLQSGPDFQQGMCPANPVQQNVAFESAVGEQSESEQRTKVQQPQAYGEESLDHQQVSEAQNPGLQQFHTPSQQISDPLVEKDPSVIIAELLVRHDQLLVRNGQLLEDKDRLLENNGHMLEVIDRLRKENELCEQKKELAEQGEKSWRDKYESLRNEFETFFAEARKLM